MILLNCLKNKRDKLISKITIYLRKEIKQCCEGKDYLGKEIYE